MWFILQRNQDGAYVRAFREESNVHQATHYTRDIYDAFRFATLDEAQCAQDAARETVLRVEEKR